MIYLRVGFENLSLTFQPTSNTFSSTVRSTPTAFPLLSGTLLNMLSIAELLLFDITRSERVNVCLKPHEIFSFSNISYGNTSYYLTRL